MKKGFSLVEIMLVLAALGGIALLVTKLGKSTMEIQNGSLIMNDYNDLVRETHFLLADQKSCQVSLANHEFNPNDKNSFVKDIELWKSDSRGINKVKKVLSKTEKFKSLNIEDVSLVIDEVALDPTKDKETLSTTGTLKVKVATTTGRTPLADIEHNLNLSFKIDPSTKVATILNCEAPSRSEEKNVKIWCGTIVNPCGTETINAVGIGQYKAGLFTGVFQSIVAVDFKICNAAKNHPANFSLCEN